MFGAVKRVAGGVWLHACGDGEHGRVLEADLQRAGGSDRPGNHPGEFATGERSAGTQDGPPGCALVGAPVAAWHDPAKLHSTASDPAIAGLDASTQATGAKRSTGAKSDSEDSRGCEHQTRQCADGRVRAFGATDDRQTAGGKCHGGGDCGSGAKERPQEDTADPSCTRRPPDEYGSSPANQSVVGSHGVSGRAGRYPDGGDHSTHQSEWVGDAIPTIADDSWSEGGGCGEFTSGIWAGHDGDRQRQETQLLGRGGTGEQRERGKEETGSSDARQPLGTLHVNGIGMVGISEKGLGIQE